jgi:hypothetical protein
MEKKVFNEEIEDVKNPTKILSYIYPLSVAFCAHTAQGDLMLYYDMRDGDYFMQKWFIAVLKQAQIVEKDNRYVDVGDDCNLPNDVMFRYNSSNFDIICFLPILQNLPDWFIVSIIGKLSYFKMIKVKSIDGIILKFLDAMNFTIHQPLKDFVKSFGSKGCDLKGMFAYEAINADNYAFVLAEKRPFAKDDFKSYLKNSVLSDKEYKEYIEEWNRIGFQDRWESLRYYNMNDVKIIISPIDNLITMLFYGNPNVHIDMLSYITLANVAQMFKWSYCFINFVPHNFLNYSDDVIPPNPQKDGEFETADMEDSIDDLNYFHFKKPKINLPTFDKKFTSTNDDNEED